MTDREKLVKLLFRIDGICPAEKSCYDCEYDKMENCSFEAKADYLIANGVLLEEKQATSDEKKR